MKHPQCSAQSLCQVPSQAPVERVIFTVLITEKGPAASELRGSRRWHPAQPHSQLLLAVIQKHFCFLVYKAPKGIQKKRQGEILCSCSHVRGEGTAGPHLQANSDTRPLKNGTHHICNELLLHNTALEMCLQECPARRTPDGGHSFHCSAPVLKVGG